MRYIQSVAAGDREPSGERTCPTTGGSDERAGVAPTDDDRNRSGLSQRQRGYGSTRRPSGMRPGADERDDAALLRGMARGDEGALASLYDRHAGWLTVRLARRCGRPDVV